MRALVTGGAGFIGTHLVERLLKEKYEVIVVDNFTLGHKENVEKFKDNKKYKFYNINIEETEKFCETLKDEKIDIVYHLAANSDIQKGGKNPSVDLNDTFMTTVSVLELMRRNDIKNIQDGGGEEYTRMLKEQIDALEKIDNLRQTDEKRS